MLWLIAKKRFLVESNFSKIYNRLLALFGNYSIYNGSKCR